MNEVDQAKLLAALLGVLKNENSKAKKALAEELSQELQDLIDQQSGTQYLQVNEDEDPVPVQVFRGRKGEKGPKGPKGARGDSGARGLAGPQGPQGTQGSIGPMGPQGLTGPEGKQGLQGQPGKDGETPDLEPFKLKITGEFEQFTRNISSQITRMAYAGTGGGSSGGGEVRLAGLDDIDMSTLDGDKFLRYNSSTQQFQFSDPVLVGDLLPAANNLYRIGSPELRWKELWLTGNTIFLGSAQLKVDEPTGSVAVIPDTVTGTGNTNAIIITQQGAMRAVPVAANGSVSRSDFDRFANSNNQSIVNFTKITSNASPSVSNTFYLGNPGREWKDLHLSGSIYINGQESLSQSTFDKYLQVSNASPVALSGSYSDLTDKPDLDQYIQVANATFIIQDKVDKYLEVSNTGPLVLRPELDQYIHVSNANVLIQNKVDKYLEVANTGPLVLRPELDNYVQVANANALIQDKVDKYLEVSNTGPLVLRPELDNYLQVANLVSLSSDIIPSSDDTFKLGSPTQRFSELYLAGNSIFIDGSKVRVESNNLIFDDKTVAVLSDLDSYLQVSNANIIIQDKVDKYLEVANTGSLVLRPELDQYIHVSNANVLIQNKVDKYLEVSNTGPLVLRPELDQYIQVANANILIQDKVDKYLQVANTGPLVLRPELNQYLQVANANFTTQPQLDKYLEVANANFATQADLDRYLQVANANSVTPDQLSQYLQVANSAQFATVSDLDNYLQVANSSAVSAPVVANAVGSGTALVESTINNIINFKSLKAGSNITFQEINGDIVISATGSLSVQDTIDFGFVSNDFGLITDGEESDPQYDFGTL